MNSNQLKRWLAKQGCTFEPASGAHLWVKLMGRKTILPMHGSKKQLGTGLINAIKKDLGLK